MNLYSSLRKRSLLVLPFICSLIIMVHFGSVQAGGTLSVGPAAYSEGTIILTPGSSTSKVYEPGQATTLIRVLTLGAGTLTVTLEKDDTRNDFISMYLIGYPADPAFIPSFGTTPGEISVSTEISDILGGVGIVFILTTINSSKSNQSSVTLALD
jgi:hypothetical protein